VHILTLKVRKTESACTVKGMVAATIYLLLPWSVCPSVALPVARSQHGLSEFSNSFILEYIGMEPRHQCRGVIM